jgi:hypothetical protein
LITFDAESVPPQVGYTGEQLPYYAQDKTLYALKSDNTKLAVYEAAGPIEKVLYVGGDAVIAASGGPEDYTLFNYTVSSKKSVEILKGDQSTYLFGVTTKTEE